MYDAEDVVGRVLERGGTIEHYGSTLVLPGLRKFGDVADVPAYLDRVLAHPPVAALPRAGVPVAVRERRGARAAHYEPAGAAGPTIAVPPYAAGGRLGADRDHGAARAGPPPVPRPAAPTGRCSWPTCCTSTSTSSAPRPPTCCAWPWPSAA